MKKMKHAFIVLWIVIMAASFFAACGDPPGTGPELGEQLTHILTIRVGSTAGQGTVLGNINIVQGTTSTPINRSIAKLNGDSDTTTGVTFSVGCTTHSSACGVTVNTSPLQSKRQYPQPYARSC